MNGKEKQARRRPRLQRSVRARPVVPNDGVLSPVPDKAPGASGFQTLPSDATATVSDVTPGASDHHHTERLLRIQRDLAIVLSSSRDVPTALNLILQAALQVEGVDCGGVYLHDSAGDELHLVCHQGLRPEFVHQVARYQAQQREAQLVWAGQPIYRRRAELLAGPGEHLLQEGLRSVAVIPVRYDGQVVAALNLGSHTHDEILASARDALETMAVQIGAVLARLTAEARLRAENVLCNTIIEKAGEGLAVCHEVPEPPFFRYTVWNDRMREITGYTLEEVNRVGWQQRATADSETLAQALQRVQRLRDGEEVRGEEWTLTRADGAPRTILISIIELDRTSQGMHLLSLVQDVTDARRAEERSQRHLAELAHVARLSMLGEVASGMAHELNQPLAAIATYADTCQQLLRQAPAADGARVGSLLQKIVRQAERSGEIVHRLRGLVRKTPPHRAPTDLHALIAEVLDLLETEIRPRRVTVTFPTDGRLPPVLADRVQIQQVVLNLLTNAFEALEDSAGAPREIAIILHRGEHADTEVSVCDTGRGIPRDDTEQLFAPFFTTKPQGLGLGLAISRSIVEAHGGRLWATPNAGRGATFRFTLPLASETHHAG